jgi:hypothetical protein
MYGIACRSLYLEPDKQLPAVPVEEVFSDAEKALKGGEDGKAFWRFRMAFDKAIYEATRHEEREHYARMARESISKALTAAENLKAKGSSAPGLEEYANALSILGKRLDEFIAIATHYYSEGPHR